MKRSFIIFLHLTVLCTTMVAQTNQVVLSFDHKVGADTLVLNQTVFSIWNNKKVILSRAEFYLAELDIHQADGTNLPLTDQYLLINANAPATQFDLGAWPVESAHGMTVHFGVPQAVNHLDPTTYPSGHALALQNPTMHWGWSAGYRFMAIEGKVDNNGDGVPETTFEYHNLGDALYKTLELTGSKTAENGTLQLHFVVDYAQLFNNMAMTGNLIQHGSATPNVAMMNNAATPAFFAMSAVSAANEVSTNSLQVSAAPNPFSSETRILYDLPTTNTLRLVVTNTLGQVVRTMDGLSSNGSVRFERNGLSRGIYQYSFYDNGALMARKQFVINE